MLFSKFEVTDPTDTISGGTDDESAVKPLGPMDADVGSTEDTSVISLVTAAVDEIEFARFFNSCSGPLVAGNEESACSGIVGAACNALPPMLADASGCDGNDFAAGVDNMAPSL